MAEAARAAEERAVAAEASAPAAPATALDPALAAGQRLVIRDLAARLADLARMGAQLRAERDRAQVNPIPWA